MRRIWRDCKGSVRRSTRKGGAQGDGAHEGEPEMPAAAETSAAKVVRAKRGAGEGNGEVGVSGKELVGVRAK